LDLLVSNLSGLWALRKRAGIMAEMADYADHHGSEDRATIAAIRSDALVIRCLAGKRLLLRRHT